ncbi:MAG: outer membrane beta-barrel protein [Gemmataceae bacterium]|nr:outer membrane beta-barrel protein [Gemmataceae bacterium]
MITTMLLGSWLAAGQAPAPMPMPMPKPMAAPMTAPMAAPAAAPAAECATCAAEPEEEATKYFVQKLLEGSRFGQCLDDRGVVISGWAAMNYTASSTSRLNNPVFFNDFANDFQLNQVWLQAVKSIDTSKKERQFGYNLSGFYGRDYQFTLPRGLFSDQVADARNYGFDLVYHYGEVFLPNLGGEGSTVRVGRWGTLIGYEVIDAPNTPLVSKSYNFQYNPFTHTGAMITTQWNENVSTYSGVVTGSDVWIDPAARATYVGGIKYAPKDGKGSIAFNSVIGTHEVLASENFTHFNSYNMLFTYNVSDKLTYVLDATFSHADNFAGVGSAHWYGFANYFQYKISDKVASNLRVELFEDTKGVRTGFSGLYTAATWSLNVTPNDWAILRPFVRYDYNSESRPFEGDPDLFTGGIELIFRY